ncbi:hypothetical protein ACSSS7_000584 [Eimeria intestinalis]
MVEMRDGLLAKGHSREGSQKTQKRQDATREAASSTAADWGGKQQKNRPGAKTKTERQQGLREETAAKADRELGLKLQAAAEGQGRGVNFSSSPEDFSIVGERWRHRWSRRQQMRGTEGQQKRQIAAYTRRGRNQQQQKETLAEAALSKKNASRDTEAFFGKWLQQQQTKQLQQQESDQPRPLNRVCHGLTLSSAANRDGILPLLLLQKRDTETALSPPPDPHLADKAQVRRQLLRRAPSHQCQAAAAAAAAAAGKVEAAAAAEMQQRGHKECSRHRRSRKETAAHLEGQQSCTCACRAVRALSSSCVSFALRRRRASTVRPTSIGDTSAKGRSAAATAAAAAQTAA